MLKKLGVFIGIILISGFFIFLNIFALFQLHKFFHTQVEKTTNIKFIGIPGKDALLGYETFKGCQVPIKADGVGGTYRWIADVPWGVFTIEEKCAIAFSNGGILNDDDIEQIRQKYGSGRRR